VFLFTTFRPEISSLRLPDIIFYFISLIMPTQRGMRGTVAEPDFAGWFLFCVRYCGLEKNPKKRIIEH
jgi:hypothetical protein